MFIGATEFGKATVVDRFDPVLDRWFTRSSWFTFLICRRATRLRQVNVLLIVSSNEFGDDYQVGTTTGVLFLRFLRLTYSSHRGPSRSLRYHRLHPEYIQRIERLGQAYNLHVLLPMRDIMRRTRLILTHPAHPLAPQSEHQDPIRELTKICLLNNITVIVT